MSNAKQHISLGCLEAVLQIPIYMNPELLPESGFTGPDPAKKKTDKLKFIFLLGLGIQDYAYCRTVV